MRKIPAHRGTIVCAALGSQVRYTSAQAAASWPRRPHHARSFARRACICNTEGSQPDNARRRGLASFWLTNRQRRRNERGPRLGYSLKPSTRSRIWRDALVICQISSGFAFLRPAACAAAGKKISTGMNTHNRNTVGTTPAAVFRERNLLAHPCRKYHDGAAMCVQPRWS